MGHENGGETVPDCGTANDNDSIRERVLLCGRREGGGPDPSLLNESFKKEEQDKVMDDEGKYFNAGDMATRMSIF